MTEWGNKMDRALVVCGLWLYGGLIGAVALAAGLVELFGGQPNPWALGLTCLGGALAAASWRRARAALEHSGKASAVATQASSPSTSHAFPRQAEPGAMAKLSPLPLQPNRGHE
jgi:hypothetical protein